MDSNFKSRAVTGTLCFVLGAVLSPLVGRYCCKRNCSPDECKQPEEESKQVQELMGELETARQELAAARKPVPEVQDKTEEIRSLQAKIKALEAELASMKAARDDAEKARESLTASDKSEELMAERAALESELKAKEGEIDLLRNQKKVADQKADRLSTELTLKAQDADAVSKEAEGLRKQLADLAGKLKDAKATIQNLTQENYELKIEIQNLTATNESLLSGDVAEHERYLWVKNRPVDVPIDAVAQEVVAAQRSRQIEDNAIEHECRDQDPEEFYSMDKLRTIFHEVLAFSHKSRSQQPLARQLITILQGKYEKAQASSELNFIYAGLFMAYQNSDMEAVLMARAFQLFHKVPMPTIGGNLFARLYSKLRDESGQYSMQSLINYMYDHIDKLTGTAFLKKLQPAEMADLQYVAFRLQARMLACEGFVDALFDEKDSVRDTEVLEELKKRSVIWMTDAEILDNLEDNMTRAELEAFLGAFTDIMIDEYHVFNILAQSFEEKLQEDISYMRGQIVEKSGNEERTTPEALAQIFADKREYSVMFLTLGEEDMEIPRVLTQVLRYLEGDINFTNK